MQQGAAAELASVAHNRVAGTWRHLEDFTGKLYLRPDLALGPGPGVQHLRRYRGWHLLRAELVRRGSGEDEFACTKTAYLYLDLWGLSHTTWSVHVEQCLPIVLH
jgi:hypothetical protein